MRPRCGLDARYRICEGPLWQEHFVFGDMLDDEARPAVRAGVELKPLGSGVVVVIVPLALNVFFVDNNALFARNIHELVKARIENLDVALEGGRESEKIGESGVRLVSGKVLRAARHCRRVVHDAREVEPLISIESRTVGKLM
jgi:hypothetical protein